MALLAPANRRKQPRSTATKRNAALSRRNLKRIMTEDGDFPRSMVRAVPREVPEAGMEECVGAREGERRETRRGRRPDTWSRAVPAATGINSGLKRRTHVTRVFPNPGAARGRSRPLPWRSTRTWEKWKQ